MKNPIKVSHNFTCKEWYSCLSLWKFITAFPSCLGILLVFNVRTTIGQSIDIDFCPYQRLENPLLSQPEFHDNSARGICCFQEEGSKRACGDLDYCFGIAVSHRFSPHSACCDSFQSCRDFRKLQSGVEKLKKLSAADLSVSVIIFLLTTIGTWLTFGDADNHKRVVMVLLCLEVVEFGLSVYKSVLINENEMVDTADDLIQAACFNDEGNESDIGILKDKIDDTRMYSIIEALLAIILVIIHASSLPSLCGQNNPGARSTMAYVVVDIFEMIFAIIAFSSYIESLNSFHGLYETLGADSTSVTAPCVRSCCAVKALFSVFNATINPSAKPSSLKPTMNTNTPTPKLSLKPTMNTNAPTPKSSTVPSIVKTNSETPVSLWRGGIQCSNCCTGDGSCKNNIGHIGDNSCRGNGACQNNVGTIHNDSCNETNACKGNSEQGVIHPRSCKGNHACTSNTGTIFNDSCNDSNACDDNLGVIKENSCTGNHACTSNTVTIFNDSCNDTNACDDNLGVINKNSCTGNHACSSNRGTIFDSSCNDTNACDSNSKEGIIHFRSCEGNHACTSNTGTIFNDSCNYINACDDNLGVIKENSCKGNHACSSNVGTIGIGSCNDSNACDDNIFTIGDGVLN